MKLRLTENPKDWREFTGAMGIMAVLVTVMSWWKGNAQAATIAWVAGCATAVYLVACAKPRWFRGFYRLGKPLLHSIGQVMGMIILTVFYFGILTPLGCLLRLSGREFFSIRRPAGTDSYWRDARKPGPIERMF